VLTQIISENIYTIIFVFLLKFGSKFFFTGHIIITLDFGVEGESTFVGKGRYCGRCGEAVVKEEKKR
jgi:hypothetical protein